jgi:hypothetical protein
MGARKDYKRTKEGTKMKLLIENWRKYLEEEQIEESLMLRKHKQGWYLYAQLVAEAYKTAPNMGESLRGPYEELGRWLEGEWRRINSRMKVKVVDHHPYKTAADLRRHIDEKGIMLVSRADSIHPVWTGDQGAKWNVMFRLYHDFEGHYSKKRNFNLRHEIASYNTHAKRVPQACVPILFTEVVGQICCFYNSGKDNCPQKATILDDFDFFMVGALTSKGERRFGYTLDEGSKLLVPVGSEINIGIEK